MSWNRPSENGEAVSRPLQKRKGFRFPIRGSIASVIVILGASIAAWWLWPKEVAQQDAASTKKDSHIREVTPNLAPKSVAKEESTAKTNELSEAWRKFYDGRDTNKWVVIKDPNTGKEKLFRRVRPGMKNRQPPLYTNHALNILDAIAFKPIISPMFGVRIDDKFIQSFQEGLFEKIEIKPDDPEEIKQRKQGMIDLMSDLKKRIKEGEDLRAIVKDSLAERNNVAALKRMMQQEIRQMRDSGASEDEIEDFGNLCNKKLEEKGALPIMTQKVMEQRLIEREAREKAKGEVK